ncbi:MULTISPECIES: hypothetical protein [unclassified Caballeronia]|uniref:CIS tube protein n=1 Tax=unclassified Caballeronia TaxID=2646786 RepID=UPI0028652409|nr:MULTISPECIES: hypothetical protein [unclassified Caballeronia]MDR5816425.1 hypothetical protein [Caballeronia sp. LZ033]MDR5823094.1 hypothetical protein [Caballeronia sp. LZ043]MDR5881223.1 hypothetical protein [Caballeronia sp. LZ032]
MSFLSRRPVKLKLESYDNRDAQGLPLQFQAMYNPDSVSLGYHTDFATDTFINTNWKSNRFVQTKPGGLSIELLFDAKMPGNRQDIDGKLHKLRKLCYDVDETRCEPRYIKVIWGKMKWSGSGYFFGRLQSLSVRYTLFEKDGTPLRATATLQLAEDQSLRNQAAEALKKSPSKAVAIAKAASSLASIAKNLKGKMKKSPGYLKIAKDNNLDSIDGFKAGDKLKVESGKGSH